MADTPGGIDFPDGFELWPAAVQQQWLDAYHDLWFPKLRWWEKPESDDEDSGPRPKQLPPDHPRHGDPDRRGYRCGCVHKIPNCQECPPCPGNPDWSIWLQMTGRGTGKTKAGSNWVLEMALSKNGVHVGVCAPTYEDVRAVCIEGQSGIIAEARRHSIEIVDYNKNRQEIELANGSKIRGFSAEKPDSIRGQNLSFCWFDELAMIRYFAFFHEGLMPALRLGERPRLLITTTPKRVRLIRKLLDDARNEPETGVHLTEAISAENVHFSRTQRERLEREYAGSYMLRQELRGELVGEIDGALFPVELFNEYRVFDGQDDLPAWRRVVVGYDPATTSTSASDESGIVVVAEGEDGDFYCLEDCSGRYTPEQQMHVLAEAVYRNEADCVVAEVNVAGDFIRSLLATVDPNIPIRTVRGMRGKVARAQGASSLFYQGRIHMVGDGFRQLEEQLGAMTENDDRSGMHDDRADAFAWCMIHLAGGSQGNWGIAYGFRDCTVCGGRVNEDKDTVCPHCGAPVVKAPPKHAGGRPAKEPWSVAYMKECHKPECGKMYPVHERSCPYCSVDPETFISRALSMQQGGGGKLAYTGRNWLAGRRF